MAWQNVTRSMYIDFGDFVKGIFRNFYPPVNTDKPKFVAFLVFVCTTASFIAQTSSSENFLK